MTSEPVYYVVDTPLEPDDAAAAWDRESFCVRCDLRAHPLVPARYWLVYAIQDWPDDLMVTLCSPCAREAETAIRSGDALVYPELNRAVGFALPEQGMRVISMRLP